MRMQKSEEIQELNNLRRETYETKQKKGKDKIQ